MKLNHIKKKIGKVYLFRNPFFMENEEEPMDNKNDFGQGDGEDPDGLRKSKKNEISDFKKILYEDNKMILMLIDIK